MFLFFFSDNSIFKDIISFELYLHILVIKGFSPIFSGKQAKSDRLVKLLKVT